MGYGLDQRLQMWVQGLALPLPRCVALGKYLNLTEVGLPLSQNKGPEQYNLTGL